MVRLLLFALLCVTPLNSLFGKAYFKAIGSADGMPDNSVNCVSQDARGFIWMGTSNGLCRYDGVSFTVFRNEQGNHSSLSDNDVHKIARAPGGFFVAHDKGVDFYSYAKSEFTHGVLLNGDTRTPLSAHVNTMVVNRGRLVFTDNKGNLYVSGHGLSQCVFEKVSINRRVSAIGIYKDGLLVAVGVDGVYLLSPDARRIVGRCDFKIDVTFNINIYYSHNADLVYVCNGIGKRGYVFKVIGGKIEPAKTFVPDNLMDVVDFGNTTVFGVDGRGVYQLANGQVSHFTPANSNLSGDAVYSLYADKDSNLWVGTYRNGVNLLSGKSDWFNVLNRENGSISYDIVTAVMPYRDKVYMGFDGGGLGIYDINTRQSRSFTTSNSNIAGNNITSILRDGDDLWMTVFTKGLVRYSTRDNKFTLYSIPVGSFDNNKVWTLYDDRLGNIWVGGPDLFIFNKRTGKFSANKSFMGLDVASFADRGDNVWVGTKHRGIYKVNKRSQRIAAHYKLPSKEVKYIYSDSRGNLWFTLYQLGFYRLSERTLKLDKYGAGDGLINGDVTAIAEDNNGLLWMGTSNGLFKYNSKYDTFVRYGDGDNIPSMFTYGAGVYHDGTMYFGSTNGLLVFKPSGLNYGQGKSSVSFLSLQLFNYDNKVFNMYGQSNPSIKLSHDQNFMKISFSISEIAFPEHVYFSCYMKGFDGEWRQLGNHRQVVYTNIPPGEYDFYVRCTDSNGRWGKPSVLRVVITPPWYATLWARLLWVLIIIAVIAFALMFYLHELHVKHKEQIMELHQNAERKLNEAKMSFYTQVTHELRTPIFIISAQVEELMGLKGNQSRVPLSYLDSLHRNAMKLNNLISRIVGFHKADIDKVKLNLQRRNVVEFCRNLSEDYGNLCEQKNIAFNFHSDKDDIELDFDLDKLETILTNLVSNAFKYTKEGGVVMLEVEDRNADVLFSVIDNGIGIVEKMRDAIFENFIRTRRGEAQSPGDGVGLATVKTLVERHGGTIKVQSVVSEGSKFTFNIPKKIEDSCEKAQDVEVESRSVVRQPANPTALHSILVIDDERDTVSLLERNLSSDFKIFKAYDGEEGLRVAAAELPDIIICDIMMPKMDGLRFLETLRDDKRFKATKVIIFSAKSSEEDMIRAYDNGADAYLTKPVSLKYLRKRIGRLVEQIDNAKVTEQIAGNNKSLNKEEQIFMLRCREIIDDNLRNSDFNVEYMADKLAMSHSSLYKKIRGLTGLSLIEFINDYKIYKAVRMFREGAANVDYVCEQCGFNDPKNFRQMFKRKMNMTPKEYVLSL